MTILDDKEKAAENKYAHDKELEFKVHARRNKLFGAWIAEKIGLEASQAEEYVVNLIQTDVELHSEEALINAAKDDLARAGQSIDDKALLNQLAAFESEAHLQIEGH